MRTSWWLNGLGFIMDRVLLHNGSGSSSSSSTSSSSSNNDFHPTKMQHHLPTIVSSSKIQPCPTTTGVLFAEESIKNKNNNTNSSGNNSSCNCTRVVNKNNNNENNHNSDTESGGDDDVCCESYHCHHPSSSSSTGNNTKDVRMTMESSSNKDKDTTTRISKQQNQQPMMKDLNDTNALTELEKIENDNKNNNDEEASTATNNTVPLGQNDTNTNQQYPTTTTKSFWSSFWLFWEWLLRTKLYIPMMLIQCLFGTFYIVRSMFLAYGIPYVFHLCFVLGTKMAIMVATPPKTTTKTNTNKTKTTIRNHSQPSSSWLQQMRQYILNRITTNNNKNNPLRGGDHVSDGDENSVTDHDDHDSIANSSTSVSKVYHSSSSSSSLSSSSSIPTTTFWQCNSSNSSSNNGCSSPPTLITFLTLFTMTTLIVHPDGHTWIFIKKIRDSIMSFLQSSATCWSIVVNDYGAILSTIMALSTFVSLFFVAYVLHETLKSRSLSNRSNSMKYTGSASFSKNSNNKHNKRNKKRKHGHQTRHHRIRTGTSSANSRSDLSFLEEEEFEEQEEQQQQQEIFLPTTQAMNYNDSTSNDETMEKNKESIATTATTTKMISSAVLDGTTSSSRICDIENIFQTSHATSIRYDPNDQLPPLLEDEKMKQDKSISESDSFLEPSPDLVPFVDDDNITTTTCTTHPYHDETMIISRHRPQLLNHRATSISTLDSNRTDDDFSYYNEDASSNVVTTTALLVPGNKKKHAPLYNNNSTTTTTTTKSSPTKTVVVGGGGVSDGTMVVRKGEKKPTSTKSSTTKKGMKQSRVVDYDGTNSVGIVSPQNTNRNNNNNNNNSSINSNQQKASRHNNIHHSHQQHQQQQQQQNHSFQHRREGTNTKMLVPTHHYQHHSPDHHNHVELHQHHPSKNRTNLHPSKQQQQQRPNHHHGHEMKKDSPQTTGATSRWDVLKPKSSSSSPSTKKNIIMMNSNKHPNSSSPKKHYETTDKEQYESKGRIPFDASLHTTTTLPTFPHQQQVTKQMQQGGGSNSPRFISLDQNHILTIDHENQESPRKWFSRTTTTTKNDMYVPSLTNIARTTMNDFSVHSTDNTPPPPRPTTAAASADVPLSQWNERTKLFPVPSKNQTTPNDNEYFGGTPVSQLSPFILPTTVRPSSSSTSINNFLPSRTIPSPVPSNSADLEANHLHSSGSIFNHENQSKYKIVQRENDIEFNNLEGRNSSRSLLWIDTNTSTTITNGGLDLSPQRNPCTKILRPPPGLCLEDKPTRSSFLNNPYMTTTFSGSLGTVNMMSSVPPSTVAPSKITTTTLTTPATNEYLSNPYFESFATPACPTESAVIGTSSMRMTNQTPRSLSSTKEQNLPYYEPYFLKERNGDDGLLELEEHSYHLQHQPRVKENPFLDDDDHYHYEKKGTGDDNNNLYYHPNLIENPNLNGNIIDDDDEYDEEMIEAELKEIGGRLVGSILDL